MLPRQNRLTSDYDFEKVKRFGQGFKTRYFGISYVKTRHKSSRFGIIVVNKLDKRAVYRNKVRRYLRQAIHEYLPNLSGGYDVVLVAFKTILRASYEEICDITHQALSETPLFRLRNSS